MHFQAIAAQLELLAWRDAQLAAISLQLEVEFPDLLDELAQFVEGARLINLVRSTLALKASVAEIMQVWGAKQLETALVRAEAGLDQTMMELPGQVMLESDAWEQVTKALPALAGAGLIAGSVAAIPTVISFATVSTSVLAFWGAASISWPMFAIGAAGIGLATLAGSKSLKIAEKKARTQLRDRLHREASRQVFGIGRKPGERCMLSDIQAAIVHAGQHRIRGALS